MATYEQPYAIELVDGLPKTLTGKILKRMLKS
jgi:acyl-coenzyme A synthetase/AMP-(fatty) acid ligase